jgi:hypothetical protein
MALSGEYDVLWLASCYPTHRAIRLRDEWSAGLTVARKSHFLRFPNGFLVTSLRFGGSKRHRMDEVKFTAGSVQSLPSVRLAGRET